LPIILHRVGLLDDTGDPFDADMGRDKIKLKGVVEIPMWYHTNKYLFVGTYKSTKQCPLSMLHLRIVNIITGLTKQIIPLDCKAGMIYTNIYENVNKGHALGYIDIGFYYGRIGCNKEFYIGNSPRREKLIDHCQM
jgi:hypothetical protein